MQSSAQIWKKIVFEDWYEVSGLVTVVSLKYSSVRVGACLVGAGHVHGLWKKCVVFWGFLFFVLLGSFWHCSGPFLICLFSMGVVFVWLG